MIITQSEYSMNARLSILWKILAAVLLSFSFTSVQASDTCSGFEIRVRVNHYPDSLQHELLLGRYHWASQYIVDTAIFDSKTNTYVFEDDSCREGGLYMIITADNQYVEFILDKDQHFEIEVTYPQLFSSIQFTGSEENEVYQKFTEEGKPLFEEMNLYQKEYQLAQQKNDPSVLAQIKEKISQTYQKMEIEREKFIAAHPEHLMSAVFRAQRNIDVPPAPDTIPEDEKGHWRYEYYKNHYFDNYDLCDDRILRTPLFYQRIKTFHDKVLYMQSPDSIKFAWERLIEKARCNKEMFKMLVWYPVDEYQRSEIIGQDAIWVYLAKKYYLGGDAYWASKSIVENFRKRINRVEPLLIGNRPQEFYCPDTTIGQKDQNWVSVFSSPKRYSVIIFWSLSCGHCQTAMPQWYELYQKRSSELDFEVFAICKDFDVQEWKSYIQEHGFTDWINLNGKESNIDYNDLWDIVTTPTVYVLDRAKRIVTKKIDAEHLEDFIRNWQQTRYPEEPFPFNGLDLKN